MMNNKKTADFLHELVRRRNLEQVQNQELNNWTETEECLWQDRTDEIYATAKELEELEKQDNNYGVLTIDEAIDHANEVANRCDSACSKQHKQLADWLSELKDLKSKYSYLSADFDNYKKRVARTEAYAHDKAFQDVILHFLSIYDDMERLHREVQDRAACGSDYHVVDIGPVNSGFEMIFENFEKTLKSLGCEKLSVRCGDTFDVNTMEAVSATLTRPDEGYRENEVYSILQSGWKYKDKVLRPVKVIVSK